jgi:hypothetical protein
MSTEYDGAAKPSANVRLESAFKQLIIFLMSLEQMPLRLLNLQRGSHDMKRK